MNKSQQKQIEDFRFRLHLDVPPFDQMEDEYFSLVVPDGTNNYTTRFLGKRGLHEEFGGYFEQLEWLGDTLLESIIRNYLFNNYRKIYKLGDLDKLKSHLVRNITLYCLLVGKTVCLSSNSRHAIKRCADRLETTIGLLYYYLDNIHEDERAFHIINTWFLETFDIERLTDEIVNGKSIPCSVPNEEIILEGPPEETFSNYSPNISDEELPSTQRYELSSPETMKLKTTNEDRVRRH